MKPHFSVTLVVRQLEAVAPETVEREHGEDAHGEGGPPAPRVRAVAPVADLERARVERDARVQAHAAEHLALLGEGAEHEITSALVVGLELRDELVLALPRQRNVGSGHELAQLGNASPDRVEERVDITRCPRAQLEVTRAVAVDDAARRVRAVDGERAHRTSMPESRQPAKRVDDRASVVEPRRDR